MSMLEVSVLTWGDRLCDVEAELLGGSRRIGQVPRDQLIPTGSLRALVRVDVVDEDSTGRYSLVVLHSDACWRILPEFEDGLWVYAADLAPDLDDTVPRQRERQHTFF